MNDGNLPSGECGGGGGGRSQIFWGARDRLVFAWEATGWNQLYSLPVTGGKVKLLTPGEFEVEFVAQDGYTYALISLRSDQLIALRQKRIHSDADTAPAAL